MLFGSVHFLNISYCLATSGFSALIAAYKIRLKKKPEMMMQKLTTPKKTAFNFTVIAF
jgi:hypothetical protein